MVLHVSTAFGKQFDVTICNNGIQWHVSNLEDLSGSSDESDVLPRLIQECPRLLHNEEKHPYNSFPMTKLT